jgi:hypothetical protein
LFLNYGRCRHDTHRPLPGRKVFQCQ